MSPEDALDRLDVGTLGQMMDSYDPARRSMFEYIANEVAPTFEQHGPAITAALVSAHMMIDVAKLDTDPGWLISMLGLALVELHQAGWQP